MAYSPTSRRHAKVEEIKTKVSPELKDRVDQAAAEAGLQRSVWIRAAVEHVLTMREVDRRLASHNL